MRGLARDYPILNGKLYQGKLLQMRDIGRCKAMGDRKRPAFALTLWPLPNQKYYLVQNRSNRHFTLFSSMELDEAGSKVFRNPIGRGYFDEQFPEHLLVQLNFPHHRFFINLQNQKKENSNV